MREHTSPAEAIGDWRDWKSPELHRFKPESLHGNLLPLRTNGVLVKCRRIADDAIIFVHNTNIEPIAALTAKVSKPSKPKVKRLPKELSFLEGLL